MRKVETMNKNFLQTGKRREVVFLFAVICLLASAWAGYSYKQSYDKGLIVEQNMDKQIDLSYDLYSSAVQFKNDEIAALDKVHLIQKKLSSSVNEYKHVTDEFLKNSSLQDSLQKELQKELAAITDSLNNLNKNISIKVAMDESISELVKSTKLTAKIANQLKKSLKKNGISELSGQLDGVLVNMNVLNNLTHAVFVSDEKEVVEENLDVYITLFDQLAKNVEEELVYQGKSVFSSDKSEEKKQLITLLNKIPGKLKNIKANVASYIVTDKNSTRLQNQSKSIISVLQVMKANHSTIKPHPIKGLPLDYLSILIVLLVISFILIFVWAFMVYQDGNRLRMGALELHAEAEERNRASEERSQKEQDSILRMMDGLSALSDGDLTVEMEVTEDFTGAIADSINYSIENMRDMVKTITLTSEKVLIATSNTQNTAETLEETSRLQSEEINRSNATVSRISTSLDDIAHHSDSSAEIAQSSVNIAQDGGDRVKRTVKSMWDIRDNIKDTSKRIKRLGESSQEIGDIVEIIKGIADQTNILALNAAIQATSAGEAGKGFAVVADEVQRLAERSGQATKQIETLVKTIQADANEAVSSMESSTTQVVHGTAIAEEAGVALDKIERVSHNLSNLIINVSDGTRSAANMAHDVAKNMDTLAKLNEKSVQNVSSSVESVGMLSDLSGLLKESVAGFKLEEDQ